MKVDRILFLQRELCFSGIGERARAIGEHLAERGCRLAVAGRPGSRSDALRAAGWTVEEERLPQTPWRDPFAFARIRSLVRRLDPQIVVASSGEVAALAAACGRPYVLELDREPLARVPWNRRRLIAVVLPDSTMIAGAVNRGGLARQTLRVIGHGPTVDEGAAAEAARALARGGPLRLGCAGYLDDGHGVLSVLEAAARLRERGLDLELFVFGEGPAEEGLRRLARERGLAAHTTISAPAAPSAARLLATLDVYVSPMLGRSPGWLAHMALALGLPTIFTTVSGAFELVEDGVDGRLIGRGEIEELCAAVRSLHDDPTHARDMGARARRRWTASGRVEHFRAEWSTLCGLEPREALPVPGGSA